MLRTVGRLIMVPLGFLLGAGVAISVLLSLGLERITHALAGRSLDAGGIERVIDALFGFVSIAGAATIVPAFLIAIVGEVVRIRSLFYYVLGGGLALGLLPILAKAGASAGEAGSIGQIWPVFATAGFAGGFAYWLVAGRKA